MQPDGRTAQPSPAQRRPSLPNLTALWQQIIEHQDRLGTGTAARESGIVWQSRQQRTETYKRNKDAHAWMDVRRTQVESRAWHRLHLIMGDPLRLTYYFVVASACVVNRHIRPTSVRKAAIRYSVTLQKSCSSERTSCKLNDSFERTHRRCACGSQENSTTWKRTIEMAR
jgi:hypothetical protein